MARQAQKTAARAAPAAQLSPVGLPFVTADLARRTDGAWRVIEVGDGQVSDRPATTTPDTLIAAILTGSS